MMDAEQRKRAQQHLHHCLQREVLQSNELFTWFKTIQKAYAKPERRFNFWWRIAHYWYEVGNDRQRKIALWLHRRLRKQYGLDIKLGAQIGAGLKVMHYVGIVISSHSVIGENLSIRQNVTIGVKHLHQEGQIYIGNDVDIGAHSCIIGDNIHIGHGVTIGAMTFVNKDIPDNATVYNKRETEIIV